MTGYILRYSNYDLETFDHIIGIYLNYNSAVNAIYNFCEKIGIENPVQHMKNFFVKTDKDDKIIYCFDLVQAIIYEE